jgi:hypothetical protein
MGLLLGLDRSALLGIEKGIPGSWVINLDYLEVIVFLQYNFWFFAGGEDADPGNSSMG